MNLEINKYQEIAEVSVSGSIDELGAEKMEQCFSDIDPLAIKHVVLDFGSIDYIGSAGVGTLLLLYKKLAPQDGDVHIKNIPRDFYNLLAKDMNLGQVIKLSSK